MNGQDYIPRSRMSTDDTAMESIGADEQILNTSQPDPNEWRDQYLRIRADMDNLRKRVIRDRDSDRLDAIRDFTLKLLPTKDALERGVDMARTYNEVDSTTLMEGVDSTLRLMNKAFSDYGIQKIDPVSEQFNPELHEAVAVRSVLGKEPGIVLSVFEKGYRLNGRLIRPAKVLVSGDESQQCC